MIRLVAGSFLLLLVGSVLLLSEFRWFRSRSLAARIAPYLPGGRSRRQTELMSVESFGQLLSPLAEVAGGVFARLFGVSEELPRRLRRVHWDLDPAGFRLRQLGWATGSLAVVALFSITLSPPLPVVLILVIGAPLITFLLAEQQLAKASDRWKERTFRETPIVAEQLGMLLGSGYSLGAALARVAERGTGTIATDLTRVVARVRQGTSEVEALNEWAELVDVDAVRRLVAVLSLNREAGDLGGLVAAEARTSRADAHRSLLESIERKNQQVWIPVTVAALVPGVLLMGIPFFDALRSFGT